MLNPNVIYSFYPLLYPLSITLPLPPPSLSPPSMEKLKLYEESKSYTTASYFKLLSIRRKIEESIFSHREHRTFVETESLPPLLLVYERTELTASFPTAWTMTSLIAYPPLLSKGRKKTCIHQSLPLWDMFHCITAIIMTAIRMQNQHLFNLITKGNAKVE